MLSAPSIIDNLVFPREIFSLFLYTCHAFSLAAYQFYNLSLCICYIIKKVLWLTSLLTVDWHHRSKSVILYTKINGYIFMTYPHIDCGNFGPRDVVTILLLLMNSIVLIRIVVIRSERIVKGTWCTTSAASWVTDWLSSIPRRRKATVHSHLIVSSLFSQRWLAIFEGSSKHSCSCILESSWSTSPCLHKDLSH